MLRTTWIFLVSAALLLGCPDTGDDVPADDDASDDDAGDDDAGDDDDSDCTVDMQTAEITASCTETGPDTGTWTFDLELDCWAESAWIEAQWTDGAWGADFDPVTGDPAECAGAGDMAQVDFGWNETTGYFDIWTLEAGYDPSSADPCVFPFSCDQASDFQPWACACDAATAECECTEVGG